MRYFGYGKPKEVPKTGFMGDTSPEQEAVLQQFKDWIKATEIVDMADYDDYDYLRFCRARKFELPKIMVMFQNFANWRKAQGVDDIINTYDFAEYNAVQEHYPHGYHKTDKQGRPIYIERVGLLNVPAVFALSTPERMVRHYIQAYEILMKLKFPACSAAAGKKVEQGLSVLDLTHGSITTVNKQVYGLIKLAAQIGSDYYPEIMGNLLIVNAPIVFSGVWSVCKGFLDEKTRKKVKIVGYGFKAVLLEYIDDKDIPSFLGGQCECKEFGGCMKSNLGPWNDYEIAGPKAIKKREKFHPDVNGRCIFFGPDGTPNLKVRDPEQPIAEMVGNLED